MHERSYPTPPIDEGELDFCGRDLRALYQDIRLYQRLLNETETTDDEKKGIVDELDSRWPYLGDVVTITGKIKTVERSEDAATDQDAATINYTVKDIFLDNEPVVSQGFNIYYRPVTVAGEVVQDEAVIGYYFFLRSETGPNTMFLGQGYDIRGVATLDDVVLEFPTDPMDTIVRQVSYFFPEASENVDQAILNAEDESTAVMALKGVAVPLGPEVSTESLGMLIQYINSIVDFDDRVPYQLAFGDLFYVVADDDPNHLTPCLTDTLDFWGYPKCIELIPHAFAEGGTLTIDGQRYICALRVEELARDSSKDSGASFVIPITEQFYMASIRSQYYQDMLTA